MMHLPLIRNTGRIALLTLTLGGLVAPRAAWADEVARSRLFDEALTAAQAGRWEEAQVVYEKLWNERHTYDVALLLGQAEYNLKRFREAAEHLTYGLMLLPTSGSPQIAERSRQILALCKQEIGTLNLRVKNKGAEVLVDGTVVAEAPLVTEVFVEPGRHRFDVRLAGHTPESFTMVFAIGQTKVQKVELEPLGASAPGAGRGRDPGQSPTEPPQPFAPLPVTHASWTPAIIGGIVTVVGLSAGVGFELVRQASDEKANTIRDNLPPPDGDKAPCVAPTKQSTIGQCERLLDALVDFDRYGRMELASFIVSGVALIGTGTYFLLARPDRARPTSGALGPLHIGASIAKGSGYLGVTARF